MKLIKLLAIVIVGLVVVSVTLTNRTVDEGVEVATLQREIASIKNANTIIHAQVSRSGSLATLSHKIEEAGFQANPKIVSVVAPTSVASR